jgi:sugar lactone lactonase YvrE
MRMGQPFGQSADPAGRIAFDAQGNLYFADTANQVIRKIDAQGIVHRFAGTPQVAGYSGDGGPALSATLSNPVDLAFAPDGTLYFTDVYNHCVRKIATNGTISTAVGVCGQSGFAGDGGPPEAALLKRPYGIELAGGVLYIADTGNHAIRSVVLP